MSAEIEQLIHLFRLNGDRTRGRWSAYPAQRSPGPEANHIAFNALHLLDARAYAASLTKGPAVEHGFESQTRTARGIGDISGSVHAS